MDRSLPVNISRTGCVVVLALLASVVGCERKHAFQLPKPTVEVTPVVQQDVPIYREWIGSLDGMTNAAIRAQVSGYLLTQDYREGSLVKKDDTLFHIDPRPSQAALDQAKGTLNQAKSALGQAQGVLGQAQAQLTKTDQDVRRYTPLAKTGAVSQEELDNAVQANEAAKANVDAAKANVEAAKANIEAATAAAEKAALQLEFATIRAPVAGLVGLAQAQIGDLVGPTGPQLTTVSVIDPIKALFTISEQEYLQFLGKTTDRARRQQYQRETQLELVFPDGSTYPEKGEFYAVQREVDPRTGTLQLVGLFPNKGLALRPGQFVRVRANTHVRKGAMLVPQRAVTELQSIYEVAVVDEKDTVQIRTIEVGERYGTQWIVTAGVKPGERIVVEGLQKASQGTVVDVKPFVAATQPASGVTSSGP